MTENDKSRMRQGVDDETWEHYGCWTPLVIALLMLLLICLTGCKTRYVTMEKVRTDTTYITKHQYDSIYLHDSIYLREYSRGETLFVEKTKWKTLVKEKRSTDTLYVSKTDSIPMPYPVEKSLTWWQGTCIKWFPWALALLAGLLVYLLRKPLLGLVSRWP